MLSRFRLTKEDLLALRNSAVVRLWLRKSWLAWVSGALYAIFAAKVFPAIMRPVLALFFPPVRATGLRGILTGQMVENPMVGKILAVVSPIVWLFGFSLVMALLELKVKPAIAAARARSRELEEEAERRRLSSPSESVMLLRDAFAHAVDPERKADLQRKIDQIAPPAAAPAATLLPDGGASRRIGVQGRYVLESELGRGGMGVVWRARDTVLDRAVAVKELPRATGDLRERFRQEARALARLSHPNVVQVYDLVEEGERLFMAMELVEGGDLHALLERGALAAPKAAALARQIAAGLAFAHAKGIVHRDVKPLNVLVTGESVAKVTDFGLAKLSEASMHTQEGAVLGSPRYMSPEQAAGKPADAKSDVYAFGVTLFHMLAGRPPFDGDTASVLAQHITQPAPKIDGPMGELVARMLEKDPAERPTMEDVSRALA